MEEIWKTIDGYEGYYEISSLGRLRSCDRTIEQGRNILRLKGRLMKPHICSTTGYYMTMLSKSGISKRFPLHRLIAKAFVPNPENKPLVDHINGNRTDNRIRNLRWCTNKENLTFQIASENRILCKQNVSKKVAQLDKTTLKAINVFRSVGEVKRQLGFAKQNIILCCNGVKPSSYGYKWKYISEDEYRNYKK